MWRGQRHSRQEVEVESEACDSCSGVSTSLWTHGLILQARILEWVAIPSSRGSSQPRARTQVSHITGRFFTVWATREATALFRGCWQTCALCPLERTITLIILRGWQVFPGAGRVWSSSSPGCLWAEDTLDLYSPRMEINRSKLTDGA